LSSFLSKRKNRKAQVIVTGTAIAVTALATGGLSLIGAGIGAAAWWLTGKATQH
jgi:hypothetical protein